MGMLWGTPWDSLAIHSGNTMAIMGKLWEFAENLTGILWEYYRSIMVIQWENTMRMLWECYRNSMGTHREYCVNAFGILYECKGGPRPRF